MEKRHTFTKVVDVDGRFKRCLFSFSSPSQRPLSAAHTAWPQSVPTIYCDCHQAHGGQHKGGSVPIVLYRIVDPSLSMLEEHRGFGLTNPTATGMRVSEVERESETEGEEDV